MLVLERIEVILYFNPRSLTGATSRRPGIGADWFAFQSTLPYGSDALSSMGCQMYAYFNPRSLTGATVWYSRYDGTFLISIHAPLRERRHLNRFLKVLITISIHAPLRERHFSRS